MTDIAKVFYGCEPEKAAIETQFKKLDKDKNQILDFNEFKVFVKESMKKIIGNMWYNNFILLKLNNKVKHWHKSGSLK